MQFGEFCNLGAFAEAQCKKDIFFFIPWFPLSARAFSSLMAKKSALMISGWLYGLSAGNTSPLA